MISLSEPLDAGTICGDHDPVQQSRIECMIEGVFNHGPTQQQPQVLAGQTHTTGTGEDDSEGFHLVYQIGTMKYE
jgi:predicted metalloprotease